VPDRTCIFIRTNYNPVVVDPTRIRTLASRIDHIREDRPVVGKPLRTGTRGELDPGRNTGVVDSIQVRPQVRAGILPGANAKVTIGRRRQIGFIESRVSDVLPIRRGRRLAKDEGLSFPYRPFH
jgi:hypothetical protein